MFLKNHSFMTTGLFIVLLAMVVVPTLSAQTLPTTQTAWVGIVNDQWTTHIATWTLDPALSGWYRFQFIEGIEAGPGLTVTIRDAGTQEIRVQATFASTSRPCQGAEMVYLPGGHPYEMIVDAMPGGIWGGLDEDGVYGSSKIFYECPGN